LKQEVKSNQGIVIWEIQGYFFINGKWMGSFCLVLLMLMAVLLL
jgi:hypothetical protein